MKAIILLGIVGVITALVSPFAPWGTIKIETEYPEHYYGPKFPEEFQIPGSLIVQQLPLMLGVALVMASMFSSAINPKKQYLVGGILQLTGGIVMLMPLLYGFQAFYWGQGVMMEYLKLANVTVEPEISIGWGVPLYLVGTILPIIAGCIWLGISYSIVEKES